MHDIHGQIDFLRFKRSYLNLVRGDTKWEPIIYDSVGTCQGQGKLTVVLKWKEFYFINTSVVDEIHRAAQTASNYRSELKCNPFSALLLGCVNSEIFKVIDNLNFCGGDWLNR